MTIVVTHGGSADALRYFVNKSAPEDLVLRLYTNDVEPGESDEARKYIEAKGYGYAAVQLRAGDWTILEGPPAAARAAQKTFTFTGPLGKVYGYYLTRAHNGRLAYAERFPAPQEVASNGDRIKIAAMVTFRNARKA